MLKIVSEFSWNEKLKLKFVSQQFHRLIADSLSCIKRLVIFNRLPIIPDGQFKFSEEEWNPNHCLYVTDMNNFFELNLKNLQELEKLAVFSVDQACKLNFQLPKLQHLELHNLTIFDLKLLSSPRLASFYNEGGSFKSAPKFGVKKLQNLSISSKYFVEIGQALSEIDYLEIPETILRLRLDPLIGLKVRRIKINADLRTAVDLCEKFACVERLDLNLTMSATNLFESMINPSFMTKDLHKFFFRDKSKAALFIFGAKVTRNNYRRLISLIKNVVLPKLNVKSNRMTLEIDDQDMLEDLEENDEILGAFHRMNEGLVFEDLYLSNSVFNKLGNVTQIAMCLLDVESYNEHDPFNEFLLYFPKLMHLEIEVQPYVQLNNRFLDQIPLYCPNLVHLRVQCFDKTSFGFLSKLHKLKYLMITTYHAWRHRVTMRLFKQLKYLSYFRLSFLKPENGFNKEDLGEWPDEGIERNFDFLLVSNNLSNLLYLLQTHRRVQKKSLFDDRG